MRSARGASRLMRLGGVSSPFARLMQRSEFLSPHDEARRLVDAADPGLREMIQAALLTGCRYSELIALCPEDFDSEAGTIRIRTAKSGKARHVILTDDGVTLFRRLAADKEYGTVLLRRPDGLPWGKAHAQRPLNRACEAARISPARSFSYPSPHLRLPSSHGWGAAAGCRGKSWSRRHPHDRKALRSSGAELRR